MGEGRLSQRPITWMPPQTRGKERFLSRDEVATPLRAARSDRQARTHLPLFILLGVYGGQACFGIG
jgi:hypothetical protein